MVGLLEETQNSQTCYLLELPMRRLNIETLTKAVGQYEPEKQYQMDSQKSLSVQISTKSLNAIHNKDKIIMSQDGGSTQYDGILRIFLTLCYEELYFFLIFQVLC